MSRRAPRRWRAFSWRLAMALLMPFGTSAAWSCTTESNAPHKARTRPLADPIFDPGVDEDGGTPNPATCPELHDAVLTDGPLLGAVSDRGIKVWARAEVGGELSVRVWPRSAPERVRRFRGRFDADGEHTATIRVSGLSPATAYGYSVATGPCAAGPARDFTTLPEEGEPARVRFASAGDVNGGDVPGFIDLVAAKPAFVLMVGDNVYTTGFGDDVDSYRERYLAVWRGAQFRALFERTAAFSTWDDHELVDNYWDGKNDAIFAFASELFDAYQGSRNPDPLRAGERYYSFRAGQIGFFVLDTRSHRSNNADPDGPDKSMLGAAQLQALLDWLKTDRSRIHVLLSSVLMSPFTSTGRDSWQGFAHERGLILDAVATARPENLIVISGDQHWSAIMKLSTGGGGGGGGGAAEPYVVHELQATPLAFVERGAPKVMSDDLLALDNAHEVFSVFDVDTTVEPPVLHYTLCVVGEACAVSAERYPIRDDGTTHLPYTVTLRGGDHGFVLQPPP